MEFSAAKMEVLYHICGDIPSSFGLKNKLHISYAPPVQVPQMAVDHSLLFFLMDRPGVGKSPNSTSPNYWGYHLQHIFESDVQNPQTETCTNPCKTRILHLAGQQLKGHWPGRGSAQRHIPQDTIQAKTVDLGAYHASSALEVWWIFLWLNQLHDG